MYNFKLFIKNFIQSFFHSRGTHARLTRKRVVFITLFYLVWPLWGIVIWFSFLLDFLIFPRFDEGKVEKPLFIIGNFRSGSTYLQRLISLDPKFTSPTIWDIFISPSITLTKFFVFFRAIDRKLGDPIFKLLKRLDQRTLGKVEIHKISFFEPEEDENFLLHLWSTFYACTMFPFFEDFEKYLYFDRDIPEKRKKAIMRFYQLCMRRHMFARPNKTYYLSKNPSFSPKIQSLLETFPNGRFVYLVRDPMQMLPSTVSWFSYTWHTFGDPLEKYPNVQRIKAFSRHWYEYPLDILDKTDPEKFLIIPYEDLTNNTIPIVEEIYKKFRYEMTSDFHKELVKSVKRAASFRSKHTYDLAEMNLSPSKIRTGFGSVYDRFDFPYEQSKGSKEAIMKENPLD